MSEEAVENNESGKTPEMFGAAENFLIVGIGASAGGIKVLKNFFAQVSADSGMAYVVILHLSPDHDSQLAAILQTTAAIPVTQVTKKVRIEPNHVYVVPPNQSLKMLDGHIVVSDITNFEERRAPVDIFFRTLAESHESRAVAVILSGTGANGSMGVKRVKEKGGVIFVQDPKEAEYNDMPRHSLATGLVDDALPAAAIPAKILAYRNNLGTVQIPPEIETRTEADERALREIFTHLRVKTGHDFSNYKRATVLRRIERRINVRELRDLLEYAVYMREQPEETDALLRDLLISVTNFFRDGYAFDAIETEILPKILVGKTSEDTVRVWCAGCATGEEAYSLAMLLAERTFDAPDAPSVQIFATDIDEHAIAHARDGFYTLNDAADVSPERLRRFFTKEDEGYRVRREIRELILFAAHNLIKDAPFSHLDLMTCRNLLIYLNRTAQARVMEIAHFALNPNGYLLLGSSESIDGAGDLFTSVNKESHIFQSRPITSRVALPLPDLSAAISRINPPVVQINSREQEKRVLERLSYVDLHQQLLEQYAPPSVVVNEEYDILHLSERAGRYLQMTGGEPTFNLLKMIRQELRLELRTALYQAVQRRTNVETRRLQINDDGRVETINIHVRPSLRNEDAARGFILVVFEPTEAETTGDAPETVGSIEPVARQLEEELVRTKMQLRMTTEQFEVQSEEYKASNEELQAMNEELRSAAEELETSKEELQSLNEELQTVNQELKIKIEEISQSNNDFRNLINSTDIGTIFLDRNLRVSLFSPAVRNIFNLIPADLGRSLSDITNRLADADLARDAETVLEKLYSIEREVETDDERVFMMRILPYRTAEDRISGVVMTFVDITRRKRDEDELVRVSQALERQSRLFDTTLTNIRDFAYTFGRDGRFLYSNQALLDLLQLPLEDIIGANFYDLNYPPELAARLHEQIQTVFDTGQVIRDETPFTGATGAGAFYEYIFTPVYAEDGATVEAVAGSTRDITTRKRQEANLAFLADFSQSLINLSAQADIVREFSERISCLTNASVCAFFEINQSKNEAVVAAEWHHAADLTFAGSYRISELIGEEFKRLMAAGETVVVRDTGDSSPAESGSRLASSGIGSFVNVPLIIDGEWKFVLGVYQQQPYDWRADEIALLDESARRIWTKLERLRFDQALQESEENLRVVVESAIDYSIFTLGDDGLITSWSKGGEKIYGYTPTEIIGSSFEVLFTPEDRAAHLPEQELANARRDTHHEHESWHLRKNGTRFYATGSIMPLLNNRAGGFVKICRDMTAKMQTEKILREKEMLEKLVGAQEDERKRLARDLHDHLGQQLTVLRMKLETMSELCETETRLCAEIGETQTIARSIDDDLSFIAWELRPASLDDLGLTVALTDYVSQWQRHSGVTAELHVSGLNIIKLLPEIETCIYRIAQEALNNIWKHARATHVSVIVKRQIGDVTIIIEDDGIGFDVEAKNSESAGLGLIGMRERAALVGGTLDIESQAGGGGTTVYVRIPFDGINRE